MSMSQLLVILVVALFVFGPNKLPLVASHLGKLMRRMNAYKELAAAFWQRQLLEQQLQENIKKAQKIDVHYQQKNTSEMSEENPNAIARSRANKS